MNYEKQIDDIEEKIKKLRSKLRDLSTLEKKVVLEEIKQLEGEKRRLEDEWHREIQKNLNELQMKYIEETNRKEAERREKQTPRGIQLFKDAVCDFCAHSGMCEAYKELDPEKMVPCILAELLISTGVKDPGFKLSI